MILLVLLLIAAGSVIYLLLKHKKHAPFNPPPGPKGLPIIGNLHQFDPSKTHIYFAKLAKIYGPILSMKLGCISAVVVQSSMAAKEVLQRQDLNFCYRPSMVGTQKLTYNGLDITFAHSLDYFRQIKKICVVHLFNTKKVEYFAPIRQEEVMRIINKISSMSAFSQTVNLSELVLSYVSSSICRTAFGKRYGDDEVSQKRCLRLLSEAQTMFTAFFFTDYFPSIGWLDKLIGQSSRLEKTFKDLDALFDEIINDHLHPNRVKNNEQEDLVDILLEHKKQGTFAYDLTLDNIKAVLLDMFVAGADTSAAMIVWAMTELIKNPSVMRKVQQELRNTLGDKKFISEDDLPNLQYFKAVVKETLRFHPAAPILVLRQCQEKCTIQGYDILPKTVVFVNVWAIGRDPECWENANSFMPDRFLGSSIDYKGQDFEFIPFGAGRKMCPGMVLGVANFELPLANLLYSFDWELPAGIKIEDIDTDTLPGITMHKRNPLCLVPRKYPA